MGGFDASAGFGIGGLAFLLFAIVGLILLIIGIAFLCMNIKWKKEKEAQGIKATANIIGMIVFGLMTFFGAVWLVCFGIGAIVFGLLGQSM